MTKPPFLAVALAAVLATALLVAWLATRPAVPKPYLDAYREALAVHPGSETAINAGLHRFIEAYADLTAAEVGARVADLYSDPIYFNDTLKTFRDREALVRYMEGIGRRLDFSRIAVDQVVRDGPDVFVRWTMHFGTSALGRTVDSQSPGLTHLRFDDRGRIVLHQDFWDPAGGLYRHLPVIGYALDFADRRMTP